MTGTVSAPARTRASLAAGTKVEVGYFPDHRWYVTEFPAVERDVNWQGYLATTATISSTSATKVNFTRDHDVDTTTFGTGASGYDVKLVRAGKFKLTLTVQARIDPASGSSAGVSHVRMKIVNSNSADIDRSGIRHTLTYYDDDNEWYTLECTATVVNAANTSYKVMAWKYNHTTAGEDYKLCGDNTSSLNACSWKIDYLGVAT